MNNVPDSIFRLVTSTFEWHILPFFQTKSKFTNMTDIKKHMKNYMCCCHHFLYVLSVTENVVNIYGIRKTMYHTFWVIVIFISHLHSQ